MTTSLKIPSNYQTVMPYLILKGAADFLFFTKTVFNAKEITRVNRDENIIMHAEINIGGCTMMIADATGDFHPETAGLFIYVEDADATYKNALDAGATVVTAITNQPYGRSGGVKDPFGNTWWITAVI